MSKQWRRSRGVLAATMAAVFAVLGIVALARGFAGGSPPPDPSHEQAGTLSTADRGDSIDAVQPRLERPTEPASPRPPSPPVRLDISDIEVHTALLKLGLNDDGSLQVPWEPLRAGWFTGSPVPGELGPSVIAGHVDSAATGPAVFYRLGELSPGDTITVTKADGSQATFTTYAIRTYPKAHFPTVPVYGNTPGAELRLITCGSWDSAHREYAGNVVVFARLKPVPGRER